MKKNLGIVRVCAAVPDLSVADPLSNAEEIIKYIDKAEAGKAGIAVFPELCLTGSTCGDLFFQKTLYDAQLEALSLIAGSTLRKRVTAIIGMYLRSESGKQFSCAAVLQRGAVIGIVPKAFPSQTDKRWFAGAPSAEALTIMDIKGIDDPIPFGCMMFTDRESGIKFGIEIGTDMDAAVSPGQILAAGGANIILVPAAIPDTSFASLRRAERIKAASERCGCGYVYCGAGTYESNTDHMFSGRTVFAESGEILSEGERFSNGACTFCEVDFESAENARITEGGLTSFADLKLSSVDIGPVRLLPAGEKLIRKYEKNPFVPENRAAADAVCDEVFAIQSHALERRMRSSHTSKLVVGISGGLDSTLALLTCCAAQRIAGRAPAATVAVTMPGFGTSDLTYRNALEIMRLLGTDVREISIVDSVKQHFRDIGQDIDDHDTTYENAQARERTQILMDVANQENALVIGTGDLSEIALGWCTYNGDHMSMYAVNGTVPKTMMRHMIRRIIDHKLTGSEADSGFSSDNKKLAETLASILDTPVSPELLPTDSRGAITQKTEDRIGPYELHDFFIYHTVKHGMGPEKLFCIARASWGDVYDDTTIKKWLDLFYRRFFTQQFKRDCSPGGAAAGPVSLSPRGGWQAPSEAVNRQWLRELDFQ